MALWDRPFEKSRVLQSACRKLQSKVPRECCQACKHADSISLILQGEAGQNGCRGLSCREAVRTSLLARRDPAVAPVCRAPTNTTNAHALRSSLALLAAFLLNPASCYHVGAPPAIDSQPPGHEMIHETKPESRRCQETPYSRGSPMLSHPARTHDCSSSLLGCLHLGHPLSYRALG